MRFIKLFIFDFKNGILKNKLFFISVITLSIVFCIDFTVKTNIMEKYNFSYSFGDVIMYIYGGMKEYTPIREERFSFPAIWVILMMLLLFGTLNYPYNNLHSSGKQILFRTQGRSLWWLSKCMWNIAYNILYHGFIWLCILLYCILSGYEIGFNINTESMMYIFNLHDYELVSNLINIPIYVFMVPILISVVLNLIQMTFSLFVKPIFSFLIMSCITISSAYIMKPYFIGNYAMLIRSDCVINEGINFNIGILISVILIVFTISVGLVRFYHYDILNS